MSHIKQNLNNLINSAITNFASPTLAEISEVDHENYTCKCIGLSKTGEKTDVVYPVVPIPKFWASSTGGIFMAPSPETIVLLNFLDNDTNYPIIATIMGSDHSEESKEDTLIITCGKTKLIIDDKKIFLSADGVNLGQLLTDMIDTITKLETTIQTPLTGKLDSLSATVLCPSGGGSTSVTLVTSKVSIDTGDMVLDTKATKDWIQTHSDNVAKMFHTEDPS